MLLTKLVCTLRLYRRDERGANLVEYALLVALIAIVCVTSVAFFGSELSGKYNEINSSIG